MESDKVKKSKYFKDEIWNMSKKLAIMISNGEYIKQLDSHSDNTRRSAEDITRIIEKVITGNLRQNPYNTSMWNDDTKSTKIMKALGYDGIDCRGVKDLDNSTFGSVIYDIKEN